MTDCQIIDYGDLWFDFADIAQFSELATDHIRTIVNQGTTAMVLGGDHYISYPSIKAHAEKFGTMSLLQFDAHTDTWEESGLHRLDHGTMMRRAINEGLIDPSRSCQVGIWTTNKDTMGVPILDSRFVHLNGPLTYVERIKEIIGNNPVYITFDIDCLDPAYAPGTGTPVWGGLSSIQASIILRELIGINVIGMDVVEVSPPYDHADITAIAGAHVAVDLICLCANKNHIVNER